VRLCEAGGELFVDITAWVAVAPADVGKDKVGGVDPGVIHPLAVAAGNHALLISGRAIRAEEFLHLQATKARQKKMSAKRGPRRASAGQPRQFASRRWQCLARSQRCAEAKDRRVVRLASNRAARLAAKFLLDEKVGVVAIGNPTGIEHNDAGPVQNRRVWRWARTHQRDALAYRLEELGISFALVDERGTSSTCPGCGAKATKAGRKLVCRSCKKLHHRDVAGAQNMVRKLGPGYVVPEIARIEHRRVGTPSRRDRRRHLYDVDRGLARTRAATPSGVESLVAPAA
jgi:putative transposase